jgi:pimeloyl-ACP methyl ester carboxylesterase
MQDRFFERDAVRLRYRDEGDGAAVLWLHGWTLDLQMWDLQAQALRDEFRIIRLDRRGFGRSTGYPSVADDVADLSALCNFLQLERVALVGMSQGARVAAAFAQARPAALSCVVLDGPPNLETTRSEVPLAQFRELVRAEGLAGFRREWRRHPLVQLLNPNQQVRAMLDDMIARYPGADLLAAPPAVAALPAPPALESLQIPVLVLYGAHDSRSRAAAARALAARLPDAESAVINAAGHMPNLDNPHDYNAKVRAFLARHTALPLTR